MVAWLEDEGVIRLKLPCAPAGLEQPATASSLVTSRSLPSPRVSIHLFKLMTEQTRYHSAKFLPSALFAVFMEDSAQDRCLLIIKL